MDDKTVFISYRRKLNSWPARSIFGDLKTNGYDVFMDVESIDSGNFESIILNQIAARAHFLVVLTPGSLEQTKKSEDWMRREVEHAIELDRNVVPVMIGGFDFEIEAKKFLWGQFPGRLERLRKFQGLNVHEEYFGAAMDKLRDRYLKEPIRFAVTPAPQSELSEVKRKIKKTADSSPDQSILAYFGQIKSAFSKFFYADKNSSQPLAFTVAAPTLSEEFGSLKWTPVLGATDYVLGATDYVLETCRDQFFSEVHEVYKGDRTECYPTHYGYYYRVKAENNAQNLESPWSNVIFVA
jgi:hypothetical protein